MNDELDSAMPASGARPEAARILRTFGATAWLLVLGACAQPPAPKPSLEAVTLQQRMEALERRVDVLERYIWNLPSPPLRSRDEVERNIRSLESRRSVLLDRYTNSHPEVREIDLSLRLLKLQLEMMDLPSRSTK